MRNDRRPGNNRRNPGGHRSDEGGFGLKSALYTAIIILALGLIAFFITINVYNKSLNKAYSDIETKVVGEAKDTDGLVNKAEEASSQIGNSMENSTSNEENISTQNNEVQVVSERETNETIEEENVRNSEEPKTNNTEPAKRRTCKRPRV